MTSGFLTLERNDLTGSLPEIFDQFDEMVELRMNENHLQGPLPESMGRLSKLGKVLLARSILGRK